MSHAVSARTPRTPDASRLPDGPRASEDPYIVKRGDTLWDIARDHGVTLQALLDANPRIRDRNMIFAGTEVRIPGRGATRGEPAAAVDGRADVQAPARPVRDEGRKQASRREAARAGEGLRQQKTGADAAPAAAAPRAQVARGLAPAALATAASAPAGLPAAEGRPRPEAKVDVSAAEGLRGAQRYDFFRDLIESRGGRFYDQPGQKNVVGLRRPTDPHAQGGRGAEDDRFVMLWVDKAGKKHVREYRGTTEGSERNRQTYSSDVNGDGRNDLGRIPVGFYDYAVGSSSRLGDVLRPTTAFQVQRDFNQDGRFEGKRERNADLSAAFLFHEGSSAGCQTMGSDQWQRFWKDLHAEGRPNKIGYTLVNA